jgi:hypothetical protein
MFDLATFPYKAAVVALAIVSSAGFGYVKGAGDADNKAQKQVIASMTKSIQLQQQLNDVRSTVVTQYVDKIHVVKEKETTYVETAKTSVPPGGYLSNGFLYLHDTAAKAGDADRARASDASSSDVKDNQALATIVSNYSVCLQNAQQLTSLQQWITDSQAAIEKSNKK